jgi:DNA-directed RNA polymerase subunit RPC12/RpoP
MEIENLVMNNITQKTKVITCPTCGKEYFCKINKDFIRDFGECLECDKHGTDNATMEYDDLNALLANF